MEALTAEQRQADPRTSPKKLHVMESPFNPLDRVVLVPAIHTDFAVLHVQKATPSGAIRIEGQTFGDVQQALCADTGIITAEEIVPEDLLRREPERNPLPYFVAKYVCHVPYGAHPYAVFNCYDYDPRQLTLYHDSARDDTLFEQYLDKFVYGVKCHADYLEAIGGPARLAGLQADPDYGYRPDLKRRRLE